MDEGLEQPPDERPKAHEEADAATNEPESSEKAAIESYVAARLEQARLGDDDAAPEGQCADFPLQIEKLKA